MTVGTDCRVVLTGILTGDPGRLSAARLQLEAVAFPNSMGERDLWEALRRWANADSGGVAPRTHIETMVEDIGTAKLVGELYDHLVDKDPVPDAVWKVALDRIVEAASSYGVLGNGLVDLAPYLDGLVTRPTPEVGLARSDGLRLLYAGKEHTVIGEMESGKSWFALACAVAEIRAQRRVLYVHFEESDPTDSIFRLRDLGVGDKDILEYFAFAGPANRVEKETYESWLTSTTTLVVLDGVNEGYALHGWDIMAPDGASSFRRAFVVPAKAVGAAVLSCDHVVKDRESRGRYALGSIHKGNKVDGASFLLEMAEPFGMGVRGRSHVYVTKDRPGALRRQGRMDKIPGKTFMGELTVDAISAESNDGRVWLDFHAPAAHDEVEDIMSNPDDEIMYAACVEMAVSDTQITGGRMRAQFKWSHDRVTNALTRLEMEGSLESSPGARNATIYTVVDPRPVGTCPTGRLSVNRPVAPAWPLKGGRAQAGGPEAGPEPESQRLSLEEMKTLLHGRD